MRIYVVTKKDDYGDLGEVVLTTTSQVEAKQKKDELATEGINSYIWEDYIHPIIYVVSQVDQHQKPFVHLFWDENEAKQFWRGIQWTPCNMEKKFL